MHRVSASLRPAVRQALQAGSNSAVCQSQILSKRNYWGHRYHVVPLEVHRHFDRVLRDFERSANTYWWRWPVSSFRRTLPEPFETKLPTGERVYRIEVDLQNFKPEDIKVTIKKGEVFITAKSELLEGSIKQNQEFTYQYTLPKEAIEEKVRSVLKTDGRLVIDSPLPEIETTQKGDREIPISKEK